MTREDLIGVRPCGCIVAALALEHSTTEEVERFRRDMARDGLEVRQVGVETLWDNPLFMPLDCPHMTESEAA